MQRDLYGLSEGLLFVDVSVEKEKENVKRKTVLSSIKKHIWGKKDGNKNGKEF